VSARLGDRSLFPDLAARSYLAHAGVSPPSLPVREAVGAVLDGYARRGAAAVEQGLAMRGRLKAAVAALLGGRPDEVALVSGATAGVQAVALCFPWSRGDRLVLLQEEFPANVTPWQRAAALFGLEVAWIPVAAFQGTSGDGLSRLEAELARGARLVATSAVQFRTGLAMPLREMAALTARHGAEIFVDAIQACGATPLDAAGLGLDYVACGAHKWLMGIHGAGFLWLGPGRAAALRPHLAGWLSHEDPVSFLTRGPGHLRYDRPIRPTAAALEGGSSSEVGQAALLASLELLLGLGIPAIHAHANAFLDRLGPGLAARGFALTREADPARRSSFCSAASPPGVDPVRLRDALGARGVAVSLPDGLLRFAPHWPNALAEVELVLGALDEGLAEQGRAR
jgi:selenocysteine lyase/cysteine desulfurase